MTKNVSGSGRPLPWALILLAALSVIPYLPMFQNRFAMDDHEFIVQNPAIRRLLPLTHFFSTQGLVAKGAIHPVTGSRPLMSISVALDYAVWKLNPFGYHLTNLILNLLCVLAAFILLRRLTGDIYAAWFGAGLFAVLPGRAEAVIALLGRSDLLAALFVVTGVYAYLRSRSGPASRLRFLAWYPVSLLASVCACLSKETGLVLPLLIAVYEISLRPGKKAVRSSLYVLPFFGVALLYLLYRGQVLHGNIAGSQWWGGSASRNFLMMFEIYLRYWRIILLPTALSPLHLVKAPAGFFDLEVLGGFVLLAGTAAGAVFLLVRRPRLGFLAAWFLLALAPVSNLIPIPGVYLAERWLYLPSVGLCGLAGVILAQWFSRRARAAAAVFCAIAGLYSVRTFLWNRTWRDDGSVGRAIVQTSPESHLGRNMYGKDLLDRGRVREAEAEFRKAIAIKPGYYLSHSNLAMALNYQNRYEEAESEYRLALKLNPDYAEARSNLGVVLWLSGRSDEAIPELRTAVRMDSLNPFFHYNLASILNRAGQVQEALLEYQRTASLDPGHMDAQIYIGIILGMTGRLSEAEAHFRSLARRYPRNADVWFNLALTLDTQGKREEAIARYKKFLELRPDSPLRPRILARIRELTPVK